ncbi:protein O-linked-mannose beta-1,2-N-acetylglucosaminyltransferase 1-like [Penaeus japonicus]|uniref:protein O-linked-mannose beta-1,2-N-acetylglucosaminyltransferase 1-like n=1 Tax=Penaeus japonicus TaxID=27405 RepID=UPI001C70CC0F|nr:protein O-linked-mannose beta-1,2-N-acetylglucosaminyltransferase 1-like [Penaeus japonicus]
MTSRKLVPILVLLATVTVFLVATEVMRGAERQPRLSHEARVRTHGVYYLRRNPDSPSTNTKDNQRHYYPRDPFKEPSVHPKSPKASSRIPRAKESESVQLEAFLGSSGVTFLVDGREVYRVVNKTVPWGAERARLHAGVHYVILNERSGQVMQAATFLTWQPEATRQLQDVVMSTRNGRVIVILAAPEFTQYLSQDILKEFKNMGSQFSDRFVVHDSWCMIARKGTGVIHESLTTTTPQTYTRDSSPVRLHFVLPLTQGEQCSWTDQDRMRFCESYGGYADFCRCDGSPWTPDPSMGPDYPIAKAIPVAIVTSRRLYLVLRQVAQLWASPGGRHTPIIIIVDGQNQEARDLGRLLNLTVIEHDNHATVGTPARINSIVKFALSTVFERHPKADHAIILEDDLQLAPDFIPFFHQASRALQSDPRLLFVNAFNYNSYAHTCHDPHKLYRAHGIPGYGWMTSRKGAGLMLDSWVGEGQNTVLWDWWIRRQLIGPMDMLLPEVPRTRHMGAGGVHISGYDQLLFSSQPMAKDTHVILSVDRYGYVGYAIVFRALTPTYQERLQDELETASVVVIKTHPCENMPLPTFKTNKHYVIYINQPDQNNIHRSYFVVATCLGINDRDMHESYRMMVTFPFYGNQVFVVACPNSPYCLPRHPSDIYQATEKDVDIAKANPYNMPFLKVSYGIRTPAKDPWDAFTLTNRFVVNYTIGSDGR